MSSNVKPCGFRLIFDKAFVVKLNAKAYKVKIIPCEVIRQLHREEMDVLQAEMNVAIKQILKTEQSNVLQTITTSNLIISIERLLWRKQKYENANSGVCDAVCCFIMVVNIRPGSYMIPQSSVVKEHASEINDAINTSDSLQDPNQTKPDPDKQKCTEVQCEKLADIDVQQTEHNLPGTSQLSLTISDVRGGVSNWSDIVTPLAGEISADQKQGETAMIGNSSEDVLEINMDENNSKRLKKSRKFEDPFSFSQAYSKLCKRQKLSHAMNVTRTMKLEEARLQMLSVPVLGPLPFDLM